MPYEVENSPFGAQLAGGLAGVMTGFQQGQQQKQQAQLNQADIQQAQLDRQLTQQQIAAGSAAAQRQQDTLKFESSISPDLPKGWSDFTPEQKTTYYEKLRARARAAGDTGMVDQIDSEINNLALSAQRYGTALMDQSKIRLNDAQAQNAAGLFAHQLQMAQMAYGKAVDVAKINGRYRALGGGRAGNTLWQEQKFAMEAINSAMAKNSEAHNAMVDWVGRQYAQYAMDPNSPQAQTPFEQSSVYQNLGGYQPIPMMVPSPGGGNITLYLNPQTGQVSKTNPTQNVNPVVGANPAANTGGGGGGGQPNTGYDFFRDTALGRYLAGSQGGGSTTPGKAAPKFQYKDPRTGQMWYADKKTGPWRASP